MANDMDIKNELFGTKRGYLKSDFQFFHLKDRKSMEFDFHYHDFSKIIILISGKVTYYIEGTAYRLKPWDILLISNREVHRPIIEQDELYERIVIWINPGFLEAHSSQDCNLLNCFGLILANQSKPNCNSIDGGFSGNIKNQEERENQENQENQENRENRENQKNRENREGKENQEYHENQDNQVQHSQQGYEDQQLQQRYEDQQLQREHLVNRAKQSQQGDNLKLASNLLRLNVEKLRRIRSLLLQLEEAKKSNEFGSQLLGNSLFIQFMIYLNRSFIGGLYSCNAIDMEYDETVNAIIKHINSNLNGDLSIDAISEMFYLSRYHLMHKFKQCTGFSIHNYITQKRLITANDKIKAGKPASEASVECGFNDYSSFMRAYKKLFGYSPRQLRKSLR